LRVVVAVFDPETSPEPTPQEAADPILVNLEGLIASLEGDERIRGLREALDQAEAEWYRLITRHMIHSSKALDQRKIDYTRGYFAGARHWLGGRIEVAKQRLAYEQSLEPKEDDA
jgi:hypothetical protein